MARSNAGRGLRCGATIGATIGALVSNSTIAVTAGNQFDFVGCPIVHAGRKWKGDHQLVRYRWQPWLEPSGNYCAGTRRRPGGAGATGIEICPLIQWLHERGRSYQGEQNDNFYSSLGLGIGRPINVMQSFAIVPFVDARFRMLTRMNTTQSVSLFTAERGSYSRLGNEFNAGIGFRFNNGLTIRPAVGMRRGFGYFDDQAGMSISVSYNFRR